MGVPSDRVIHLPCGKRALVSPEDYGRASQLSWSDNGAGYVRARLRRDIGGDGRMVFLHHYIIGIPPKDMVIDHIDGDPLNNTRGNLQLSSKSRNAMRSPKKVGGVTRLHGPGGRWRARMRVDGRMVSLGCYGSKEEAEHVISLAREIVWTDETINTLGVKP